MGKSYTMTLGNADNISPRSTEFAPPIVERAPFHCTPVPHTVTLSRNDQTGWADVRINGIHQDFPAPEHPVQVLISILKVIVPDLIVETTVEPDATRDAFRARLAASNV